MHLSQMTSVKVKVQSNMRSNCDMFSVADPGFPVGGGAPTSNAYTFQQKCMRKRKKLILLGGGAAAPPESANGFSFIVTECFI